MKVYSALLITGTLFLSACNQPADDPEVIAKQYWRFIQAGDYAAAEQLVSTDSRSAFQAEIKNMRPVQQVELGDSKTDISTVLNPSTENPALNQPFSTVLVLEKGKWRIDATQTLIPPEPTLAEKQRLQLAEDFSRSMQQNIDSIDDAMQNGLELLNEALRDGSREMGDSLLRGMQELNESMQRSIENMKKRKQEQSDSPPDSADTGEGMI